MKTAGSRLLAVLPLTLLTVACASLGPGLGLPTAANAADVSDVLGSTHAAGRYNFTDKDYLNEGADQLLDLGTHVIKVWFDRSGDSYPFNSDWKPVAKDYVELAQKPYLQALFAKPFTTYILVLVTSTEVSPFLDGMTNEEIANEKKKTYDLAKYLLTAYAGTGKTFVLQNWEGDHLLRQGLAEGADPDPTRLRGMIDWLNARQDGVTQARRDARARGVTVAYAAEVNLLRDAMQGKVTATNDVIPFTHCDLYSYSSWDLGFDRAQLTQALDYLKTKAPDSELYGRYDVYLGEFGAAKDHLTGGERKADVIRGLAEAALGWGVRWAVYWELYCNEPAHPFTGRPTNDDMRGFWLVRPDGTRTRNWDDFARAMPASLHYVLLRGSTGRFVTADSGGGVLVSEHKLPDAWGTFAVRDLNGGALRSGDRVGLQAHGGLYLTVSADGLVAAGQETAGAAETFVIRKLGAKGKDLIGPHDSLAIQSSSGLYLAPDPATGALLARSARPGPAETFSLRFLEGAP